MASTAKKTNSRENSHVRWEKFNDIIEKRLRDLSGSEFKLLMVYYRHAYIQKNSKGKTRNVFLVADTIAAEAIGCSPYTIRDTRRTLKKRGVIRQLRQAAFGRPPKYMIEE